MIREQSSPTPSAGNDSPTGPPCRILLPVAFILGLLSGCATADKAQSEANGKEASTTASVDGRTPKSDTSNSSPYVDPAVASASAEQAPYSSDGSNPVPAQSGIAGLATQPTGIRAGSVSIFSAPGQTYQQPQTTVTAPAAPATTGRVNATAGSMFSAPPPTEAYTPGSCGRAEDGVPLSC